MDRLDPEDPDPPSRWGSCGIPMFRKSSSMRSWIELFVRFEVNTLAWKSQRFSGLWHNPTMGSGNRKKNTTIFWWYLISASCWWLLDDDDVENIWKYVVTMCNMFKNNLVSATFLPKKSCLVFLPKRQHQSLSMISSQTSYLMIKKSNIWIKHYESHINVYHLNHFMYVYLESITSTVDVFVSTCFYISIEILNETHQIPVELSVPAPRNAANRMLLPKVKAS